MPSAGVDLFYSLEAANAQLGTKTLRCWSTQVLKKVQQLIQKHPLTPKSFQLRDLSQATPGYLNMEAYIFYLSVKNNGRSIDEFQKIKFNV